MEPIKVWRFEDAPPTLQALSINGGDEDWLAVIPPHLKDEYISWLECSGLFDSMDDPQIYKLETGEIVYIGSHA